MPSQIKVDEIKNVAGQYKIKTDTFEGQTTANNMTINAGNITVQGESTATTNLQQGLLKAWCNFTMGTSHAYRDSFNCGTLTDDGTGIATINLTNPFSNDDWAGAMFTNAYANTTTFSNHYAGGFDNRTSSSVRLVAHSGSGVVDAHLNDIHFAGDLA